MAVCVTPGVVAATRVPAAGTKLHHHIIIIIITIIISIAKPVLAGNRQAIELSVPVEHAGSSDLVMMACISVSSMKTQFCRTLPSGVVHLLKAWVPVAPRASKLMWFSHDCTKAIAFPRSAPLRSLRAKNTKNMFWRGIPVSAPLKTRINHP